MQSWFFSIITPVFSVTWSLRNVSTEETFTIIINVENNFTAFCENRDSCILGFFDEQKVKDTAFIWNRNWNNINVFTLMFF